MSSSSIGSGNLHQAVSGCHLSLPPVRTTIDGTFGQGKKNPKPVTWLRVGWSATAAYLATLAAAALRRGLTM